ncbi:carboxypeptidase_regulatory-like domain-containing protein [Hexamita inflata]|uniref:Carboxypeptidase regulatory-like domain-containing protein n=1 Tax=Hexamita inflata TaxID=28002 RepID=A0AA86PHY0_9EUKA|nr:carboxypeptidase regulatory-like domain-containing protein [Hexamita inflata]
MAFINIQDNTYNTTVSPLFQTQSQFNQIKIQVGVQAAGSGTVVASGNSLIINSLNIISRDGTQITVNTTSFKLNLLQSKTTTAQITNLLLNLSFIISQGSISLIGNVIGVLNILNYQILGNYQSTNPIALGSLFVNTSNITLNNVNFAPNSFNPGNISSFFFSQVNTSSITFMNIAVQLGSNINSQILNFPATTASYTYQFGGFVAQLNSTQLVTQDLIYTSNQSFSILYVSNSGLIIGRSNYSNNNIILKRICLQNTLKANTIISQFGAMGYVEGTIQFISSNIQFYVQSINTLTNVATIGYISTLCQYSIFINIRVTITLTSDTAQYLSSLIGQNLSPNCSILNTTIQATNISAILYAAGLIGSCSSFVSIQYTLVFNSNISAQTSYVGGFFGVAHYNVQMTNSSVQNSTLNQNQYIGGFIGTMQAGSILLLSICQIFNITISAKVHVGGFIGFADQSSSIVISDCLISNSSIIGTSSNAGGLIGTFSTIYTSCILKIVTSKISSVKVMSPTNFGLTVGYKYPAFTVVNSILEGENYLNNVKQFNCANFATTC